MALSNQHSPIFVAWMILATTGILFLLAGILDWSPPDNGLLFFGETKHATFPFRADETYHHPRRRLTTTSMEDTSQQHDNNNNDDDVFVKTSKQKHFPLFDTSDTYSVLGPSIFPKPTYIYEDYEETTSGTTSSSSSEIVTVLQPTSGKHRPTKDSVLVFATEYKLENFMLFFMSLAETGYTGDVVVGISRKDWKNREIRALLQHWENPKEMDDRMTVVVYVIPYHCYNLEGEIQESHKGGMRVCQCNNMFGRKDRTGTTDGSSSAIITPLMDKRHGRTAQTIRYEMYWIWSEYYDPCSWILLIDARDTIFQESPFDRVPRTSSSTCNESGTLLFFGENADVTSLSKSKYNRKWLSLAYGEAIAESFANKPTICSGSTMGEQSAIETYLRAEVAESDESKTVIFGADQGFHNYLYYSDKLLHAKGISKILVQDQGLGIVNNMGALREEAIEKWGNGKLLDPKTMLVHNYDGSLSPVVHQYDRHKSLSKWWREHRLAEFETKWESLRTFTTGEGVQSGSSSSSTTKTQQSR